MIVEPFRVCDLIEELKKFPPLMYVQTNGGGYVVGTRQAWQAKQGSIFEVVLETATGKTA